MSGKKIVIVGGGSFLWGPVLVRDCMVEPRLSGGTLWLHDLAPEPLAMVDAYARRVASAAGTGWTIHSGTSLDEALDGADAVILSISTGGLETMRHDLEIPERYGIVQTVGDTVGPGGLNRALRNVPVVLEIAREMERRCPNATLINLTNPMTVLTRAVSKHTSIKTIGVCHEWPSCRLALAMWLGVSPVDIQGTIAGVNHFIWALDLTIDGKDGYDVIREKVAESGAHLEAQVKLDFMERTGYLPVAGDRHLVEFVDGYLTNEREYAKPLGVEVTRIPDRERWREEGGMNTWEITGRQPLQAALDGNEPPRLTPSIEDVSLIVADLYDEKGGSHIVNLPNHGQIANLPRDAVVETYATISTAGIEPDPIGDLPPVLHELVSPHVTNQERLVDAAVRGDRDLALQVLRDDPLVGVLQSKARCEPMFAEMLTATAQWLPQFAS